MAYINKIILPDGDQYDIQVKSQNIDGVIPVQKGGTGVNSIEEAKQIFNLDAGDIAYDDTETYDEGTLGEALSLYKANINHKIDKPETAGTSGQVLTSDGQGGQTWATTTVQDGAITWAKLNNTVQEEINGKAPAIITSDDFNSRHTLGDNAIVNTIHFKPNTDAFGKYAYADRLSMQYLATDTWTKNGVTIELKGNYFIVNGGSSTQYNGHYWGQFTNKLTGKYRIFAITNVNIGYRIQLTATGGSPSSVNIDLRSGTSGKFSEEIDLTNATVLEFYTNTRTDTNSYTNAKVWFTLIPSDATVTFTDQNIGEDYSIDLGQKFAYVDTLMCESSLDYVADTKTYIDNYMPDGVLTTTEIPFITPEMFGAVGDGNTDDTVALQACIEEAEKYVNTRNQPVRGFGVYKISSPLRMGGYYLDIFIKAITYTGNDAAVIVSGKNSVFRFNEIVATTGTNAAGIRVFATSDDSVDYDGFDSCLLDVDQRIISNGNCLELIRDSSATESIMYSTFRVHKLYSYNGNGIYVDSASAVSEIHIYGQHLTIPNGYLLYETIPHSDIYLYDFCIENTVKNGVYGYAHLIRCRTVECMNHYTEQETDRGMIFVYDNILPKGSADKYTLVGLLHINADNADTWDDVMEKIKDYYDEHDVSATVAFRRFMPAGYSYAWFDNCHFTAESGFASSTANFPKGKAFVYYNHVAFKPDSEILKQISTTPYTISLSRNQISAASYFTPTVFDIDVANCEIYLDWSYCAIAINEFDVIQYSDKKAIVYDKFGDVIFDGTNEPAGKYHFKCSQTMIPSPLITMRDGTELDSPIARRALYTGSNEKWVVTSENIIEPPSN